jgi:hypothetical protein
MEYELIRQGITSEDEQVRCERYAIILSISIDLDLSGLLVYPL